MDLLLASDDDSSTGRVPSPTLRAQQDNGTGQHERPMFQEDERERKKSKQDDTKDDFDTSILESQLYSVPSTGMLTSVLNHNPLNQQNGMIGLDDLLRLQHQQSQQISFLPGHSGQSVPEAHQGLQLQGLMQHLEAFQKPQAAAISAAGGYQIFSASNQETDGTSPLPQPRPLRPRPEMLLQATSPSHASSYQSSDQGQQKQLQQDKLHSSSSQIPGLQHQAASLLPNQMLPQGFQLPLAAVNHSLMNFNAGLQPTPQFPSAMLNPNFANNMGAALYPANGASLLPAPLRESAAMEARSIISQRKPITLYIDYDDESLSPYQCLVRKHIELFEADRDEVDGNAKGRNKPIVLGQVGIRCKHCSNIPAKNRGRGSKYYPAKLSGLYQAAQSMASGHLCNHCNQIPQALRSELLILREKKSSAGGGKKYWADGVRVLGVVEDEQGLRFKNPK